MPAVPDDMRLAMLDQAPHEAPALGVTFYWLRGLDWQAVANYRQAVALDASVPHRGFAIIDPATTAVWPRLPSLRLYAPICPQRVAS